MERPQRHRALRLVLGLFVAVALLAAVASAVGYEPLTLGPGAVEEPADDRTVVSVQGFHFQGEGDRKKPARLVAAGPDAEVAWRYDSGPDARWFYDVEPLADGNLLVTSTVPGDTVVFEYDPANDTRVWDQRFDAEDTHDVDRLGEHELVVANMRNFDESAGRSDDRVFVYNRTTDEVVWEWHFRDHYPADTDGGFSDDWTHVNDVDRVAEGTYLLSPRNFDQAVVVDRETGEITMRLGEDGNLETLYEQHNPDLIRGEDGRPTILVADSENDRIVEYTYEGPDAERALETPVSENEGEWNRTWSVTGFNWPRDADRLPNGNTLVTDSLHQRVVEITPEGEVVWEFYAPWAPFDAERRGTGDGSAGPTVRQLNASGTYEVHGGTARGSGGGQSPAGFVVGATRGLPFADVVGDFAERYSHVAPFVRPVWLSPWAFAYLVVGAVVALPWGLGELVFARRRVVAGARRVARRTRDGVTAILDRIR